MEDISKRLDTIDTDISTLKNNCEINNMKKDIREATNIANDTEQYSRMNNIRIRGLNVQEHDDCKDVVADFLVNKLHLQDVKTLKGPILCLPQLVLTGEEMLVQEMNSLIHTRWSP